MTELIPEDAVPLDDRGLLLGDGLFETLLWSKGALILAREHADRMIRGAAVLGLPPPPLEDFVRRAEAAVQRSGLAGERAAVRVTLTAGSGGRGLARPSPIQPRLFATAAPAPGTIPPAALMICDVRRNAGSPASRLKTLAYLDNVLAREAAQRAGADEAVMLNTEGKIACASAANLFWISGGSISTPALEAGCLDGTIRAAVQRAAGEMGIKIRDSIEGPQALSDADAIFLTNSLVGVRPARSLGGRAFELHPLVGRLAAAVAGVA